MNLLALKDQIWFKFFYEQFGWKWDISDTLIEIGGFSIKWYGVLIAVGFLLALLYAYRRASDFGINTDRMVDVVLVATLLGFVGARLYYVVFSDRAAEYFADPLSILYVWEGGLGIYGGIIFGLGFGVLMCKLRKVNPRAMLDMASLGFLIGQAVGRWGNFFNQEAFGGNTDLPWGMSGNIIQSGINGDGYNVSGYVHPTFLYESLWCIIGFVLLHIISKRLYRTKGQIFCGYLVWYAAGRFFIESLRTDSLMLGQMRISQLVAVAAIMLGVVLYFVFRAWDNRLPTVLETGEEDTPETEEEPTPEYDEETLAEQDLLDADPAETDTVTEE